MESEPTSQPSSMSVEEPPQMTSPQVTPTSPQQHSSNTRFIVVLRALVIILLGITGGYFFYQNYQLRTKMVSVTLPPTPSQTLPTPTPDPTASWITYTDKVNEFEFKYPENWKTRNTDVTEFYYNAIRIKVEMHINATQKKLDELWKLKNCSGEEPFIFCDPQPFSDIKTLQTINREAYWRLDGSGVAHAFIPKLDYSKIVEIYTLSPRDNAALVQILSTFKFNDLTPEVSDWKTYKISKKNIIDGKNYNYSLEFKYPPGWKLKEYTHAYNFEGELTRVAIDPNEPASEEAMNTLDIYPGLIDIEVGIRLMEKEFNTKIGVGQNINAKTSEKFTGPNGPNAFYYNKHIITYQVEVRDGWTIAVTYIADLKRGEDKYLNEFDQILSTFHFLK